MTKLGNKTYQFISIGYAKNSFAYIFLKLESCNIIEFVDAEFFEYMNKSSLKIMSQIVSSDS